MTWPDGNSQKVQTSAPETSPTVVQPRWTEYAAGSVGLEYLGSAVRKPDPNPPPTTLQAGSLTASIKAPSVDVHEVK